MCMVSSLSAAQRCAVDREVMVVWISRGSMILCNIRTQRSWCALGFSAWLSGVKKGGRGVENKQTNKRMSYQWHSTEQSTDKWWGWYYLSERVLSFSLARRFVLRWRGASSLCFSHRHRPLIYHPLPVKGQGVKCPVKHAVLQGTAPTATG